MFSDAQNDVFHHGNRWKPVVKKKETRRLTTGPLVFPLRGDGGDLLKNTSKTMAKGILKYKILMVLPSLKVTLSGKFKQLYVILEIFLLLSFVKFPLLSYVYSFATLAPLLKPAALPVASSTCVSWLPL